MFKQLPFNKEYGLVVISVVLLFVSYQLAFKKTITAWQLHNQLQKQITQSADVSFQPGYLDRKSKNLDKVINLYKADTINFRSNIISKISSVAEKENVKLSEVPLQDPLYHTNHFMIQKLDFEGDYFSLVKVLKELQSTKEIGVIRSVNLRSTMILNTEKNKKLIMEIYLEITLS